MERRFDGVETWIFDLDNTLYPPRSNLFAQVDDRMGRYISALLSCDRTEARRIQKDYYRRYGTTLRGLMSEHEIDPHEFLSFVHDIDHSPIEPDPALGSALSLLPGRKFVLTNGSRTHAGAVLARLGIDSHFEDLFDIIAAEFEPKPARRVYERFLERHEIEPRSAAMFEDLPRNLQVPHEMGMATVLVTGDPTETTGHRADWESEGEGDSFVEFVTGDLAQFLVTICDRLGYGPGDPRD